MPATLVLTAIFGDMVLAAAALGSVGLAVASFAIRLVVTMVITSIIAKRNAPKIKGGGQAQVGNRVQMPPSTDNKIPVVYGSAYMKPCIIDAKISQDQKTMWHVLCYSEAMESDDIGTFSFGDIYWGDKKLIFDPENPTNVTGWVTSDGQEEDQPKGLIKIFLYRDGSLKPLNTELKAYEVLSGVTGQGIVAEQQWTEMHTMNKLVFMIVQVTYDAEKGITGLPDMTAVINNTLTKPGSVIKDYLTNDRYGANLPLSAINVQSLDALDEYSSEQITYTPSNGGPEVTMDRYDINGPVDTTKDYLSNLMDITESCDSWLQWNETLGQWGVIINRSYLDKDPESIALRQVDDDMIVGGIDLSPIDLNETYNSVEVQFPNTKIKDQPGYHLISIDEFPNVKRNQNEPTNKLVITLPFTNNIVQSQYIAARRLLQSREDLVVNFTMDYSGIQIDAGDVIGIHHRRYGWGRYSDNPNATGKLFRVVQVQEGKSEEGALYARISASEYNDGVYDDTSIELKDFTPSLNTGISDPGVVQKPTNPITYIINETDKVPRFGVAVTTAATGNTLAVEFWYGTAPDFETGNYKRYNSEENGSIIEKNTLVGTVVTGLPAGIYYWRMRSVGTKTKSDFTDPVSISWNPIFLSDTISQSFIVNFTPSVLQVSRSGDPLTPVLSNLLIKAYGQVNGSSITFIDADTDSDPNFAINTWRIGASSTTGVADITQISVNFDSSGITADSDGAALFPAVTAMPNSPAYISIPVRYKKNDGTVFQGQPAVLQLTYSDPGAKGDIGLPGLTGVTPRVWFLAPTNAMTTAISGGVFNRETFTWTTRPTTTYTISGQSPVSVANYDYAIAITANTYRYSAVAKQNVSNASTGTFTPVWSTNPQIEAGYGPKGLDGTSPQFIDFTFSGLTSFNRLESGIISPTSITFQVTASNINSPAAQWTVSGATYSTTSQVFSGDTITITPTSGSNQVTVNCQVGGLIKKIIFPVLNQGLPGTDGIDGRDGIDGATGEQGNRGFVPLAYIPITVNPKTATQAQLTQAWTTQTGFAPLPNDGGSFYYGTIAESYSYNSNGQWVAAAVRIAGDLVADGTIKAIKLAANEIFTNKLSSTNSTGTNFGSNSSPGYWLDGNTGNARFGGNLSIGNNATIGSNLVIGSNANIGSNLIVGDSVSIGNNATIGSNLTVNGLISAGSLVSNTVKAANIVAGTITRDRLAPGTLPSELGTMYVPSSISGGGYPANWDGLYNNAIYYKIAGYNKFTLPIQYFYSTGAPRFKIKWSAFISANKPASSYQSLKLYFWFNTQGIGVTPQAGSMFFSTSSLNDILESPNTSYVNYYSFEETFQITTSQFNANNNDNYFVAALTGGDYSGYSTQFDASEVQFIVSLL